MWAENSNSDLYRERLRPVHRNRYPFATPNRFKQKKEPPNFEGGSSGCQQHAVMSDMFVWFSSIIACFIVVLAGLEPATSPMWTVRSNQLNYKTLCTICPLCPLFPICPLCDCKVSSSNVSNTSISCVFVWIFAFFRGLNVHCVQYVHCVFFWLQHFCNTYETLSAQ